MTPEEEKTLREKAALFDQLVEARKNATAGDWYNGSHRSDQATIKTKGAQRLRGTNYRVCYDPTVCVLSANLIQSDREKKDSANFITLAANLTEPFVRRGE